MPTDDTIKRITLARKRTRRQARYVPKSILPVPLAPLIVLYDPDTTDTTDMTDTTDTTGAFFL